MNFTNEDRQAGRKAMEQSLTPLVKALRRFAAGRPSKNVNNSSLGAILLLTEQRQRLEKALADEKVKEARVTSQAVVIRLVPPVKGIPADTILVKQGKEGEAVQMLELYGRKMKRQIVIAGIMFAVQAGQEKRPFGYLIERTPEGKPMPEGEAALKWAWERQINRTPRKNMA